MSGKKPREEPAAMPRDIADPPDFRQDGVALRRVEQDVRRIKETPNHEIVVGPAGSMLQIAHVGGWQDWAEPQRLHFLEGMVNWDGVDATDKRRILEWEIDFSQIAPDDQKEILGEVWHQNNTKPFESSDQAASKEESAPTIDPFAEREAQARELFDISNRVMFAEYVQRNALDYRIAMLPAEQVRATYFEIAEETWPAAREEMMFREPAEIAETLELFKAKEAALREPKTLMDMLRDGGMGVDPDLDPYTATAKSIQDDAQIRPLTRELIDCCRLDVWPGYATVVDFGIDSSSHLGALQYAIRDGLVTPQELDAAMGNGVALTAIARRGDNPYGDVKFQTSWDEIALDSYDEAESPPSHDNAPSFQELRIDYEAASLRDAGEDHEAYLSVERKPYIPAALGDADAKGLMLELEQIKRVTYIESEVQVAGWNYEKGDGGFAFHDLPVADREVMIEDGVDWGKYMERGLTFEDQGRIMFHGARDVPSETEPAANAIKASEHIIADSAGKNENSYDQHLNEAADRAVSRKQGKDQGIER